jgi:pimeloyl-ACP methyl ester carboxylesterase
MINIGRIVHKTVQVNGIDIFYREAGDPDKLALLLLHGFPSSSAMFKDLMHALCDRFHLIAPDYPGFGASAFPVPKDYAYTFQNIASTINAFTDQIGLKKFVVYLHDYGSYIGLRICLESPSKIQGIIVQNGNAYEEGLGPAWDKVKDYWAHPTEEKKQQVFAFLSEKGTRDQYMSGAPEHLLRYVDPNLWMLDWYLLSRPGNLEKQMELNTDQQSNLPMYRLFQRYFREHQPPAVVIWGKDDVYFDVKEPPCYKRDLPDAKVHIIEGGHMALETSFPEVSALISGFLEKLELRTAHRVSHTA